MLLARRNPASPSSVSRRGFLHAGVGGTGFLGAATLVRCSTDFHPSARRVIVDPRGGRGRVDRELMMMMAGWDFFHFFPTGTSLTPAESTETVAWRPAGVVRWGAG